MDSDIINMMMQQMDFTNPNNHPSLFDHNNNTYPFFDHSSITHQEPVFRYNPGLLTPNPSSSSSISQNTNNNTTNMAAMREMIFRIAVMQPIHIDPEAVKPPKRRNVKISKDPQSVAARHRRERISERIRILQRLVPGGTKMDTASMLDEAIHYVKFLKKQVQSLEEQSVVGGGGGGRVLVGGGGGGMTAAMKSCGGMGSSHNNNNQMVGNAQILR